MTDPLTNIEFDDIDDAYVKKVNGNGVYDDIYSYKVDYLDAAHCAIVDTITSVHKSDPSKVEWASKYVDEYEKSMALQSAVNLIEQANDIINKNVLNLHMASHLTPQMNKYMEPANILVSAYALSYRHGTLTKHTQRDAKGNIVSTSYRNKDNLKCGLEVWYYPNHTISSMIMHNKDGARHGIMFGYYTNGNLFKVAYYKNNNITYMCKKYHENGTLMNINLYSSTNNSMLHIEYFPNGQISEKFQYKINAGGANYDTEDYDNADFDGNQISWHENGKLKGTNSYKNGTREGVEHWYYKNGNIKTIKTYINGYKTGIEITYHEDGSINSVEKYEKNKCVQSLGL